MNIKEEYKSIIDGTHEELLKVLTDKKEEINKKMHVINVLKCVKIYSDLLDQNLKDKVNKCFIKCSFDYDELDYKLSCLFKDNNKKIDIVSSLNEVFNELYSDYFNSSLFGNNGSITVELNVDETLPDEILKLILDQELLTLLNYEKLDSALKEKETTKLAKNKI